jgi:hypothetical protein
LAGEAGVPCQPIGTVGGERLVIGPIAVGVEVSQRAWTTGLAVALGREG